MKKLYINNFFREGGINPPAARVLHEENIDKVYKECLKSANIELKDVDAIAVTVEPGIISSLRVGKDYALHLSKIANKPLIPIHHMQAHALTVRMIDKVSAIITFSLIIFRLSVIKD